MRQVVLADGADLAEWREAARALLAEGVPPEAVLWDSGMQGDLLGAPPPSQAGASEVAADVGTQAPDATARVPREFLELAGLVIAHADPQRHARLYRLLWRIAKGGRALLRMVTDPDVAWAGDAAKAVRREKHKMKAFVRFREVADAQGPVYVAWFEPEHDVLPQVAPFFMRRFAGMRWSILTPTRSAHWDGEALHAGEGARRADAPDGDALEELWRVYYASIFNPARLKVGAMVKEMPVRYWKNMPETALIPGLIRDAGARMQAMVDAAPTVPRKAIPAPDLPARPAAATTAIGEVHAGVAGCRACPLWRPATQAVAGGRPRRRTRDADRRAARGPGRPRRPSLRGPGGAAAGSRAARGRHRSLCGVPHQHREALQVRSAWQAAAARACRCLRTGRLPALAGRGAGPAASAIRAVPGRDGGAGICWARLLCAARPRVLAPRAGRPCVLATVHPAYLLRLPDAERAQAWEAFLDDLRVLATALSEDTAAAPVRAQGDDQEGGPWRPGTGAARKD